MPKKTFNMMGAIVNDDGYRWSDDDVTPRQFAQFLQGCGDRDEIEILISSPGGQVTGGLAIANMIKSAKQPITAKVYGIAASMASVIACAAPKMSMYRSSFVMIHNPYGVAWGDASEMKKEAEVLESMKNSIIAFYLSKFPGKDAKALAKMMDEETWMLGSESQTYGLEAAIEDDPPQAAARITGPVVFGKMPEAAARFYVGKKDLAPMNAKPPAGTRTTPPADGDNTPCQHCAALQGSLTAAEDQRRDLQSKADRLAHELAQAKAEHQAAADSLTATVAALTADKTNLEKRINASAMNALKGPDHACAQTWDEALSECGSYEAAKKKYPSLAEAYRAAHSAK